MFAIVPCLAALLAVSAADADRPLAPSPAMIQHAAAAPAQKPGEMVIPSVTVVRATHVAPLPPCRAAGPSILPAKAAKPAEVSVPDESRADLLAAHGTGQPSWARPKPSPALALPEVAPAGFATTAPAAPADDFPATVRKNVLAGKLTPDVAVGLLVQAAGQHDGAGHRDLAREDADLAVERYPAHRGALRLRAGYRFDAGDYAGALRDADALVALDPADAPARYARAVTLSECGRPAEARRELTALIAARPGVAAYYHARAEACAALEDFADADLDSEVAVELAPAEPRHRLLRLRLCLALGRHDDVRGHFEAGFTSAHAVAPEPAARQVQVELLEAMVLCSRFGIADRDAVHYLDWMVRTCPAYTRPRLLLAAEFLREGRPDLAEAHAAEAAARDPLSARAYHVRAQARAALGRPDALRDYETALCLEEAADTRAELVALRRAAGRRREARELAQVGVELHPDCRLFHEVLAADALLARDFAAAERYATFALWLAGTPADAAAARLARGLARLLQGDAAGAAGDLDAAADFCAEPPGLIPAVAGR